MTLSVARLRHYLHDFQLEKLFVEELGWDRHSGQVTVSVDGRSYLLRGLAQKRGVQIFLCEPDGDGRMPEHGTRRKIEKQVTKSAYEHLIVFVDGAHTVQIWQWVAREHGQPAKYREYAYHPKHQAGELLVQKLQGICFPLSEEDAIDLTGTVHKLRDVFDRDSATKKFYDRFKTEHTKFLKFIKGFAETADREWYASLMLNRLMFIYFIQQKAFLAGDQRYLQNRLRMVQERKGKGRFYTFYRYFLLRLFHEGFAQQPSQRAPDLETLLGQIPYLNGGLFDVHQLEQRYPEIDIPDEAFEGVFAFFDDYEWTLDTRPLRSGKEINPDVLGYIFEKYVNQKQMGAYYTKEDITEYISKNTVIPFLFDAARKKCAIAFEQDSALWRLLRDDPDRYIYEPVRRGVIGENGGVLPEEALPDFVQKGMNDPKARMFDKRYNLGEVDLRDPDGRKLTLPTETWREYVNRRKRCLELREKLSRGEIHDINDLITYNLHIRQFAEDAVSTCEGPELLRAFYAAISSITVLDPTCGSGAFLFAALNILEPLYEACLVRMEAFLEDLEHSGERHRPEKFSDFRRVLADIEKHPNRYYFILKSIIVNNLYGVDIMEEAVEICKLRLFLKLVAQVEKVKDLEPLPDIDFNIRPGNTLVGFARLEDVKRTLDGKLGFKKGQVDRIIEDAEVVDKAFRRFHEMQTAYEMDAQDFAGAKQELRTRLAHLTEQLDRYLATDYGISQSSIIDPNEYDEAFHRWRASHQPFHWFAEFYGIMNRGGFDAIIGNPPWVEYSKVKRDYVVIGYDTEASGNLHGLCTERGLNLRSSAGNMSFIVQLPLMSSSRMATVRDVLRTRSRFFSAIPFDDRPGKLFEGLEHCRAVIWLSLKEKKHDDKSTPFLTAWYHRWATEFRPFLFESIANTALDTIPIYPRQFPKHANETEWRVFLKVQDRGSRPLGMRVLKSGSTAFVFYQEATGYWAKATVGLPYYAKDGVVGSPAHGRYLYFQDLPTARWACATLNSSLFYLYFIAYGDCFHLSDTLARSFPLPTGVSEDPRVTKLGESLMRALRKGAKRTSIQTKDGHEIAYDEYFGWKAKPTIDDIDAALATHYGFTQEELDFIINYDIKYRMGQDSGEGVEE
ncbi:MAG: DNA methyltransferase [Thermodesulfobacteriota bacterium]